MTFNLDLDLDLGLTIKYYVTILNLVDKVSEAMDLFNKLSH